MAEIIDLGNGYGMFKGFSSKYATLIFPFSLSIVKRLFRDGYIDKNEAIMVLLWMGYSEKEIPLILMWVNVTRRRREKELANARTI